MIIDTARCVIGSFCFRFSYADILDKVNWLSIYQKVNFVSLKMYRQIIITKYPKPLYNLLKPGQNNINNTREIIKYYPKILPKLSVTKDSFVFKMSEIYNSLPQDIIKTTNNTKFNNILKVYIKQRFSSNRLHKLEGYITI